MPKILIIIPAYNESLNIAGVITTIHAVVPEADILVIDDGSRDETVCISREAGAQVISHPYNMGYGVTIQTGYKYAWRRGYEYVVQIDGDGQHDPSFILSLLAPVQAGEADFVLGSRFMAEESYSPSLSRRLGMALFRKIVTIIIGQPVSDCTSGYQAFNRKVVGFFCQDIFPVDYPDADVLISLHRAGLRIKELPVKMYPNAEGASMHSGLKPVYYVFKMLLSILITLLRSKEFFKGGRSCP